MKRRYVLFAELGAFDVEISSIFFVFVNCFPPYNRYKSKSIAPNQISWNNEPNKHVLLRLPPNALEFAYCITTLHYLILWVAENKKTIRINNDKRKVVTWKRLCALFLFSFIQYCGKSDLLRLNYNWIKWMDW